MHLYAGQLLDDWHQARFFEKRARGNNGLDVGGGAGGAQSFCTCRIVEQRRNAFAGRKRQHQPERGRSIRGEDADHFAGRRNPGHDAHQTKRHFEQGAVGFFLQADVFDQLVVGAKGGLTVEKGFEQGTLRAGGNEHVEQDVAHQLARTPATQLGRRQIGHRDGASRLDGDSDFGEDLARVNTGEATKIAARRAINAHRNDGGAGFCGDKGGAVINLHQRAGFGDPPFRENHHRLPGFNQLDDLLDR